MSHTRFNQVIVTLLALSAIGAFALPMSIADLVRGRLDGLFTPVAYPVRSLASAARDRLAKITGSNSSEPLSETSVDAAKEIASLCTTIASLTLQLEDLRRVVDDRQAYGSVWKYSRVFKVIGGESSWRKSLTLRGESNGLSVGMPVICRQGLVGRVSSVGLGSAQTRLITEKGFCITAAFSRRSTNGTPDRIIQVRPPPLVEGRGDGTMAITNLSMETVKAAKLGEGDSVVLYDADMPTVVAGQSLGRIYRIAALAKEPLYADITIKPNANLEQLSEVMVVMTDQSAKPMAEAK